MRILIVAATKLEIQPFLNWLESEKLSSQKTPDILITGVGMTATAFHLSQRLAGNRYDLLVNAGIAGSFDPAIPPGTVVRVIRDCFSELGAEDGVDFISIDKLGFGQSCFSMEDIVVGPTLSELPCCEGITVNTVHGETGSIRTVLKRHPGAQVESMEGASVFYAARQTGIPAIQVRAISNYVEQRNREHWDIPLAITRLNDWLCDFIQSKSEVK